MACFSTLEKLIALLSFIAILKLYIPSWRLQINLESSRVVEDIALRVKNDQSTAESSVTICLPAALQNGTAVLEVKQKLDDIGGLKLLQGNGEWRSPESTGDKPSKHEIRCSDFQLNQPLTKKGAMAEITVKAVFLGVLHPRPATIKQGEDQRFVHVDSAHIISPYLVLKDSTTVKLPDTLESHDAPSPASLNGKTLVLGPYEKVAPMTDKSLTIHYLNTRPFLQAPSVVREIGISHWGNVYVEERYHLQHIGPRMVGEWSRYRVMTDRAASKGAASQGIAVLPPDARWIYFRDDIGNISSSVVRRSLTDVQVALVPRFPLVGGWETQFKFGYSLPLGSIVQRDSQVSGSFVLQTSINPSLQDIAADVIEMRIVLPEGATDYSVAYDIPATVTYEKQVTYFDLTGRTVIVLRVQRAVPEILPKLVVTYKYSTLALLQKPILLSIACALAFAIVVWLSNGKGRSMENAKKLHSQ